MIFVHETKIPEDKAMRYFLWADHFHDSQIFNIELYRHGKKQYQFPDLIEMTVLSIRDIDCDKGKPHGYKEASTFIMENQVSYCYKLIFEGCVYYNSERIFSCNDYLYGVFKNTAILRNIQNESDKSNQKRHYYHYRFIFDDGYIDLIFHRFKIEKMAGRIKYPDYDLIDDIPKFSLINYKYGDRRNDNEDLDVRWVAGLLDYGESEQRQYALIYLINKGSNVLDSAREIMKLDWCEFDEARTAAIWVIGLQGDESDLPLLFDEYYSIRPRYDSQGISMCSTLTPMRHVMDAIENIKGRFPTCVKQNSKTPTRMLDGVTFSLGAKEQL